MNISCSKIFHGNDTAMHCNIFAIAYFKEAVHCALKSRLVVESQQCPQQIVTSDSLFSRTIHIN